MAGGVNGDCFMQTLALPSLRVVAVARSVVASGGEELWEKCEGERERVVAIRRAWHDCCRG